MIKNERQYLITKTQVHEFEKALAQMTEAKEAENPEDLLRQAQVEALGSQLNDLKEEIQEYESLIARSANEPIVLELDSIESLPLVLIKARIAAKLSQKDLAEQLGIKEQQIQRYEANDYASAKLSRIIEVCQVFGLKLQSPSMIEIESLTDSVSVNQKTAPTSPWRQRLDEMRQRLGTDTKVSPIHSSSLHNGEMASTEGAKSVKI
jgi:transcriptional regulator with XRE-family HTH domain